MISDFIEVASERESCNPCPDKEVIEQQKPRVETGLLLAGRKPLKVIGKCDKMST